MSAGEQPGSDRQRLLESLWQDAEREAESVKNQARAQADRLLKDAVREAEESIARAQAQVRREAEPLVAQSLNRARDAVRKAHLEGLYSFLQGCLDEVHARLRGNGAGHAPRDALGALLTEALSDLPPSETVVVNVNPLDVARAGEILQERGITAQTVADDSILGGAVVVLNGGWEVRDNSLSARLKTLEESPPLEVLDLLAAREADRSASPGGGKPPGEETS